VQKSSDGNSDVRVKKSLYCVCRGTPKNTIQCKNSPTGIPNFEWLAAFAGLKPLVAARLRCAFASRRRVGALAYVCRVKITFTIKAIPLGLTFSNAISKLKAQSSKAQSSKLESLCLLKRGKRDVRALSFELSKMSPQVGLAVLFRFLVFGLLYRHTASESISSDTHTSVAH